MTPGPPPSPPRRVRVVGVSGAGKTTLARRLSRVLALPHLELDAVFWDAGWRFRDLEEARALVASFVAGPGAHGWVACGSWETRLGGALDDADLVVWLDLPRRTVMARVLRRTLGRGVTRRTLWHGNRESLAALLRRDPDRNIVRWAWTQHAPFHARWEPRWRASGVGGPRIVRLTSARAVRRWLRDLRDLGDLRG